jgi:hypothetical protein
MTQTVSSNIQWKGQPFYQVTSKYQRTKTTTDNPDPKVWMRPQPIPRIYRREIAANLDANYTGNPRTSASIDQLNMPNGYLVYTTSNNAAVTDCDGLLLTLDDQLPNNQTLLGNVCNVCNDQDSCSATTSTLNTNACFTQQLNAKRRVRSAGMNYNQFNQNRNNDNRYFADNKQYLVSRNRTFDQNQFSYIRQGNPTVKPSPITATNLYSPQGLSHCEQTEISQARQNNFFQYIWLNGTTYDVTIPDGFYDINSFNQAFQSIMITNTHYYVNTLSLTNAFLLVFSYNTLYGRIELQALSQIDTCPTPIFTAGGGWVVSQDVPQFIIPSTSIPSALGIVTSTYPATDAETTSQVFLGTSVGTLVPQYVTVHYKPSNPQFSQQGGVSSSNYLLRKKYNTITNNAGLYRTPLGDSVANAMAYNVVIPGYNVYTAKDVLGYPNKLIPKVLETGMKRCIPQKFANAY